jgi:hypothetical protein
MASSTKPPRLSLSERLERSRRHRRHSSLLDSASMGGASFGASSVVSTENMSTSSGPPASSTFPAHAAIGQRQKHKDPNTSTLVPFSSEQGSASKSTKDRYGQNKAFGGIILETPTLSVAALRASFSGGSNKLAMPKSNSRPGKRYSAPHYMQSKNLTENEKKHASSDERTETQTRRQNQSDAFFEKRSEAMNESKNGGPFQQEEKIEKDSRPSWQNRARKNKPWQRDIACTNLDTWQSRQRKNVSNLPPHESDSSHNSDSSVLNTLLPVQGKPFAHRSVSEKDFAQGSKQEGRKESAGITLMMSEDDSLYIEDGPNFTGHSSRRDRSEESRESPPDTSSGHVFDGRSLSQTPHTVSNFPASSSFFDNSRDSFDKSGFGHVITRNQSKQMNVWGSENQTKRGESQVKRPSAQESHSWSSVVASQEERDEAADFDEEEEWCHRDPGFPDEASISSSLKDTKSLSGYEIRVTTNNNETRNWTKQQILRQEASTRKSKGISTPGIHQSASFDPFSDVDNLKIADSKNMFASTSYPFMPKEVFSPPSWTPPGQKSSQKWQKGLEI